VTESKKGGAPTVADASRTKSGVGSSSQDPVIVSEKESYDIVEWRQSELPEFIDVKEAAAAWAVLEAIEQKSHWWKVEILKQVSFNRWMSEFLIELKDTHGIILEKRYANKLRALGNKVVEVGLQSPSLEERLKKLPVSIAVEVIRADDLETAIEKGGESQKSIQKFLRTEKLDSSGFEPKIYDIWNFGFRDPRYGQEGYKWGLICGQIVENLLHYYTEEKDIVLDPMAGGGTTIDVCKAFNRRCMAFDIDPVRDDILKNDITEGLPDIVQDVQLAILEPPYYNMMQDAYSSLNEFLSFLETAIKNTADRLRPGGVLALIIMDQVNKDQEKYPMIGPAFELLNRTELEYEHLVGLPLGTQQHTAYHVKWAKEGRFMLGINRQMWIFRRPA
jgi:DNA methylase